MPRKNPALLQEVPKRAIMLDTETTGFSPKMGDRIVELAAVEYIHGIPSGEEFHAYINPARPVPPAARQVHGLTDAFLRNKPTFRVIAQDFLDFLGDPATPIWAHNASFDKRFVEAEMKGARLPFQHTFSCSLKLARSLPHGAPGGDKLEALAAHSGFRWGARGAHSAIEDTRALGHVLSALLWPLALDAANKDGAKTSETEIRTKTPRQASAPSAAIVLPAGFAPLREGTDPRIKRYDDIAIDGRIFARGKRWTRDEEASLVRRFLDEVASVDSLVQEHGRTPAALMLKLEGLGVIAPNHPYAR